MNKAKTNRIESLDLLKGIVMIIMAIDHFRDYFHYSAFSHSATDPLLSNWGLFLSRFITHFCAPVFCLLAGTSAFLVGIRKSKNELSVFLLKRGIWLVFVEVIIINFLWYFDVQFHFITLQVIWMLGICMILLAFIIHLPMNYILIVGLALVFGHNLLDYMNIDYGIVGAILHKQKIFQITPDRTLNISYQIIPWVGVMALGYFMGQLYDKAVESSFRKKLLNQIGLSALLGFFVIRFLNSYGNSKPWQRYENFDSTLFSFFNVGKYPPSLSFLLLTLGTGLIFLANSEKFKGKAVAFFSTFGKVPFFYYIMHFALIRLIILILFEVYGFGWKASIFRQGHTVDLGAYMKKGFGFDLPYVYLIWLLGILLLYPICKRFSVYKTNHKEKWWLSYL